MTQARSSRLGGPCVKRSEQEAHAGHRWSVVPPAAIPQLFCSCSASNRSQPPPLQSQPPEVANRPARAVLHRRLAAAGIRPHKCQMPPKARGSRGSAASARGAAADAAAAAADAGGPSTSAAHQPALSPDFAAEKLRWALAVPPEQRQTSMQGFIDSCECTTAATELLSAAPLEQLSGPTKLRALLLLLKAHWAFGGQTPAVPGIHLLPGSASFGQVSQQAWRNRLELVIKVSRARQQVCTAGLTCKCSPEVRSALHARMRCNI